MTNLQGWHWEGSQGGNRRQTCNDRLNTVMNVGRVHRAGLWMCRWPRSQKHARVHAIITAVVLWIALLVMFTTGAGNRSIAGPIKGTDFLQFYAGGKLVRAGEAAKLYDMRALHDVQVVSVPESAPELYPPVYPPQVYGLFSAFAGLSYIQALWAWTLLAVVAYATVARSAYRAVAASLADRRLIVAALIAFPPFWSAVLYGQVTILVLVAFWAAWFALEREHPFLAGCAVGLLAIKPQFGLVLAVVTLVCGEWSIVAGALASIAVQACAVTVLLGKGVIVAYARFVPVVMRYADLLEPKPYQGHSVRTLTRLLPTWIGAPLWCAVAIALILFAVRSWKAEAPLRVRLGAVILVTVALNPHLIVYDATVLVLPLLWFGAYLAERESPEENRSYWTAVYWLCVMLLAPTAAIIMLQGSVFLMLWLVLRISRALGEADETEGSRWSGAATVTVHTRA